MRQALMTASVALVLLMMAAGAQAAEKTELLDSIIATIDNDIITLEQVELEADILQRTKYWLTFATPPDKLDPKLVFNEIVARTLLYNQARKMGFADVPEDQVEKALNGLRLTFASPEDYHLWLEKNELRDPASPSKNISGKYYTPIKKRFLQQVTIHQYLNKKIGIQVKLGVHTYLQEHEAELKNEYPAATPGELEKIAEQKIYNDKLLAHIQELRDGSHLIILRDRFK